MILDVFTIATEQYCNYLYYFVGSLVNFFPGEKKRVHIFTNKYMFMPTPKEGEIEIEFIHIVDAPWPIIITMKQMFIEDYLKNTQLEDLNYAFYFDPDSLILERNKEFWAKLIKKIDDGHVLVAENTAYLFFNFTPNELKELNTESEAYIDKNKEEIYYTKGCFFAANKDNMLSFCEKIIEMTRKDLLKLKYIPKCIDESYITKLLDNYISGDESLAIDCERFVAIPSYMDDFWFEKFTHEDILGDIFINAKWNDNIKREKRGF